MPEPQEESAGGGELKLEGHIAGVDGTQGNCNQVSKAVGGIGNGRAGENGIAGAHDPEDTVGMKSGSGKVENSTCAVGMPSWKPRLASSDLHKISKWLLPFS